MRIVYKDKIFGNPVENIKLMGDMIITSYYNTIKVYDLEFKLIREKYFYDKIIGFECYLDQIVILFSDKLIQVDSLFRVQVLRNLKEKYHGIELYNDICLVYNFINVKMFYVGEEMIRKYTLSNELVRLLPRSIPTLISYKNKKCQILTIDNELSLLEEFNTIDNVIDIVCIDQFIFVLYKHFIEVRYKRDSSVICLSKFMHINNKFYMHEYQEEENTLIEEVNPLGVHTKLEDREYLNIKHRNIRLMLYDCKIVTNQNSFYLINGDGSLFELFIKAEATKIFEFEMKYLQKLKSPSCASFNEDFFVIGSLESESVLVSNSSMTDEATEKFSVFSSLFNLGKIVSIIDYSKGKCGILVGKHICKYDEVMKFLFCNSVICNSDEIINMAIIEHKLTNVIKIYKSNGKVMNYDPGNLKLISEEDSDYSLNTLKSNLIINDQIYNVEIENNLLNIYVNSSFEYCVDLSNLDMILINDKNVNKCEFNSIKELKICCYNNRILILLKVNNYLVIYSYDSKVCERIFVDELIIFDSQINSIQISNRFIYLRSETPYLLFLNDHGLYFQEFDLRADYLCEFDRVFYAIRNNHLMMSKVMNVNIKNTNFPINSDINTENIISNINLEIPPDISSNFKSKVNNSKPTKTYLRTQYDKPKITNSISCNGYDILIVTKDESFKFVPFVSVVHKTTDKGTTTTERLEEYVHNYDTSLLSKNKRHFIILTKNHSLIIQKLMLEKDEYVTRHHFVLDKYLFISTALIESEEKSTDGRLILYEMISIVADPKAPYKDKKLKFVCDIRTKASIKDFDIIYKIVDKTFYTLEDLSICACVSTKINFYEVSHSGFTIVGRNESKLMTSAVKIFKNLIIISDIYSGVYLYFFRPEHPLKFILLGKSDSVNEIRSVFIQIVPNEESEERLNEMIINCITKYGKIISYSYKPLDSDSINGNRLLKISEIDLKYFNFPKLISNLTKNIISINNIMIQLSFKNKSGNKLDLLLNLIEKYNRNTCGLLINDYLRDDCMIRRKTLKFIVRRALLEYFNIEIEIQNIINKEMKMSFYEIYDLIKEFY